MLWPTDHRSHHPIPRRHQEGRRQPRRQSLLPLGLPLLPLPHLRILPRARDQGPLARTGRQNVGRGHTPQVGGVEATLHFRARDGSHTEGHVHLRCARGYPSASGGCGEA